MDLKPAWMCLQILTYTYQCQERFRHAYPCHCLILKSVPPRIFIILTSLHGFHQRYSCFEWIFKSMQAWISMLESMLPKHHVYPCPAWIFKSILARISMIKIHASMDYTMDIHVSSTDIQASCIDICGNEAWILGPGQPDILYFRVSGWTPRNVSPRAWLSFCSAPSGVWLT